MGTGKGVIHFYSSADELNKLGSYEIIKQHDEFFSIYYKRMLIFKEQGENTMEKSLAIQAMAVIDGIKGLNTLKVKTPFAIVGVTATSTGLKAVLNAIHILKEQQRGRFTTYAFDVTNIGWNALRMLTMVLSEYKKISPELDIPLIISNNMWSTVPAAGIESKIAKKVTLSVEYDGQRLADIEQLQNYLIFNRVGHSVFKDYIDLMKARAIYLQVIKNTRNTKAGDKDVAFPKLIFDIGKVKYHLIFKKKLTIVVGDSGSGKTLLTRIISSSRETGDSALQDNVLFNIELFTSKRKLTADVFSNLESLQYETTGSLIVIDDPELVIDASLGKLLSTSNAQIVVLAGNVDNLVYGPDNIAIMNREDSVITINYPVYDSFKGISDTDPQKFFYCNRPRWTLGSDRQLSNRDFTETLKSQSAQEIIRKYNVDKVDNSTSFFSDKSSSDLFEELEF